MIRGLSIRLFIQRLLLIVGGGCAIYMWYQRAEQEKQIKKLVIATNSGQTFSILFNQGQFLDKVIAALKEIIAHPGHHSVIIINIKDNTIAPGGSVIDSVNEINSIGERRRWCRLILNPTVSGQVEPTSAV